MHRTSKPFAFSSCTGRSEPHGLLWQLHSRCNGAVTIRAFRNHFQEQTAPDITFEHVIHGARQNGIYLKQRGA